MDRILLVFGIGSLWIAAIAGAMLSDPDYSWVRHTTSELAGQNMPNAWIMRLGFVAYGGSVIALAARHFWTAPFLQVPLGYFGIGLVGAGIWSAAPIDPALGFDLPKDAIHSVFASTLGFAFAVTTTLRLLPSQPDGLKSLSLIGLIASVALPMAMILWPDYAGLLQRIMFAISCVWLWCAFAQNPNVKTEP